MPPANRRRQALTCALVLLALGAAGVRADPTAPRQHALSLVGTIKHGPDFKHFEWVKTDAPKGGRVRARAIGTFDTLNPYAGKGSPAQALALIHATLMTPNLDERVTEYGLVAAWVSVAADHSTATFGLRPEARFHDGRPITPADVVFSLEALKKAGPQYALYYRNVVRAEETGPGQVTFTFETAGNRELPQIIGAMPVLAKHYWTGKDEKGEPRDLARSTMEAPLGSGPYRIGSIDAGRRITYERVADWWAKDLPVALGQWNFDEISYIYYRDRVPAFEAFKSGETDIWPESSAKGWATGYDIEPVSRGQLKRETFETRDIQSMQGFAFNVRRPQFQDPRVRRAFSLAFNFEWANKNLFFDQYRRVSSYFDNSELKASGLPEGAELAILETVRQGVPAEVFTKPFETPSAATPEAFRRNMGEASRLFAEAGWTPRNGILTNAKGEQLTAEVLLVQPDFERLVLAYKSELEKLGVKLDVRIVDAALYVRRFDTFDFDIIVARFGQSISPGNEQRDYWTSAAARMQGSRNLIGIENPAIDTLVERLIYARDRTDLVAATRALDRVLLWNHYVVPQFYSPVDRLAFWDKFGRPARMPLHTTPFAAVVQGWWLDNAAQRRLDEARRK